MKVDDRTNLGASPAALMRRVELERELGVNFKRVRQLLLELLHEHPREEVERILKGMLAQIPEERPIDEAESKEYAEDYRKAVNQLKAEREQFLGISDILKGLLMWVETPEERVHKNLGLKFGTGF